MPVWKLREKSCTPEGRLYLVVDIWAGDTADGEPDLTNDFIIDVPQFEYQLVRDGSGNVQLKDGTWVTSAIARTLDGSLLAKTEERVDPRARVRRIVRSYIQRALGRNERGDKTSKRIERDAIDRRSQLADVGNVGEVDQ